ncbi:hypothetical protein VP01_555g3 [Puccinia sorghi]|uniref:Uncharacterized protein n=1 Tax=Puccinia sorghi TaxID=27349 RepID=A0A0L6UL81_9BASI|nr:hypothetical protein VP01_555g3 [Puccinia sorghi]
MNINQACILAFVGCFFLAYPTLGALSLASSAGKSTAINAGRTLDLTEEVRRPGVIASHINSDLLRPLQSNRGQSKATGTQIISHPEPQAVADRGLYNPNLPAALQAERARVAAKEILKKTQPPLRMPKKGFWSRLKDIIMRPWRRFIDWKLKKAIEFLLLKRPEWLDRGAQDQALYYGMFLELDGAKFTYKEERKLENVAAFIYRHKPDLLSNDKLSTEYIKTLPMDW